MPQKNPRSGGRARDIRRAPAKKRVTSVARKMRKELSAAGNPDRWERAGLEVARPSALMLSVRIPAQLAIELESYAAARSLTISDVARHAIEQFIRGIALVP